MESTSKVDPALEIENAEKALEEVEATGSTARRCLRCGGELRFYVVSSGYRIWCEREDRIIVTVRGI